MEMISLERDILLKRMPGGIESLDDKELEHVANSRDPQLDRATDLLNGIMLFTDRNPVKTGSKMAALKEGQK